MPPSYATRQRLDALHEQAGHAWRNVEAMRVAVVDLDQAQARARRAGALDRPFGGGADAIRMLRAGRSASLTDATERASVAQRIRASRTLPGWRSAICADQADRESCTGSPSTETITSYGRRPTRAPGDPARDVLHQRAVGRAQLQRRLQIRIDVAQRDADVAALDAAERLQLLQHARAPG